MCWHKWSKWKTYTWTGIVSRLGDSHEGKVTETRQARVCLKCGMEEHRMVYHAAGSTYDTAEECLKVTS